MSIQKPGGPSELLPDARLEVGSRWVAWRAEQCSVNGDELQGVKDVAIFRPDATDYRPKWGLYRGITPQLPLGESWVEHKDVSARKL